MATLRTTTSRRAVLAGSALALSGPDPIFAAIAEFRVAYDDLGEVARLTDGAGPLVDAAMERAHVASDALITTRPTTLAGVIALLTYCHDYAKDGYNEWMDFRGAEGDRESWETALIGSLAVSVSQIVGSGSAVS